MSTLTDLPNDSYELVEFLREEPTTEQETEMLDALVTQMGHEHAHRMWRQACAEIDREAEHEATEMALTDAIGAAQLQVERAQKAAQRLNELNVDAVGTDVDAFLGDAGRALRAAAALNKQNKA